MTPRPSTRPTPHLVERTAEVSALRRAFDEVAAGSGRTLTVRGIAGIGKSTLLAAGIDDAEARGWTVLHARGDELEAEFAFGIVLQLLEPAIEGAGDGLFEGPASLARPLLASGGERLPDHSDLFTLVHGIYWAIANLAESGPVAIVVDDAQWADLASLRCLCYLARRIEDHPIALVVGTRPVSGGPAAPLLAGLASSRLVEPRPLSRAGVADLVLHDRPEVDPDDLDRWYHLTGGVPLFVEEMLRSGDLIDGTDQPVAHSLATVRARLDRLPEAARRLAAAAAIAGDGAPWWQVLRASGVDDPDERLRGELVDAALLEPTSGVRFIHPVVRQAVIDTLTEHRAQELHAAMAEILRDASAPAEVIAHHLMSGAPTGSDVHAELLEDAARRARSTGAPELAVGWLRRALLEGPSPALRQRLQAQLVVAAAAAGDPAWADDLARHLRTIHDPVLAAETRLRVGRSLMGRGHLSEATHVLQAALDEAGDTDLGDLRVQLLATLATNSRIDVSHRLKLDAELEAILETADLDTSPAARAVLAHLGYNRSLTTGPASLVREMERRAILHAAVSDDEITDNPAYYQALLALHFADDAEAIEEGVRQGFAAAERRGNETFFALMSNIRGMLRLSQGRIADALDDHATAVRTMRLDRGVTLPGASGNLALCRAARGEFELAHVALDLSDVRNVSEASASYTHYLFARGCVRLAEGDPSGTDDLRTVVARQRMHASLNPATIPAAVILAEAIADTDRAEARALLEESGTIAEAFGAPRTIATVARAWASVEPSRAIEHLERADALLEGTPWGLERMRSRVALGEALIRAGRADDARTPLTLVLAEADAGGATVLAEQARTHLLATGARPRRSAVAGPASLTPSERSVVLLAIEGLTNRQIAARRFVSVKAVEFHLANAYRKLGVESRAALAEAMGTAT